MAWGWWWAGGGLDWARLGWTLHPVSASSTSLLTASASLSCLLNNQTGGEGVLLAKIFNAVGNDHCVDKRPNFTSNP